MELELFVRLGDPLRLRNVTWCGTEQGCEETILGRRIVEYIVLDARQVLPGAMEKIGCEIDLAAEVSNK